MQLFQWFCEWSFWLFSLSKNPVVHKATFILLSNYYKTFIWDILYRKDMLSLLLQLPKIATHQVFDTRMVSENHIIVVQELIIYSFCKYAIILIVKYYITNSCSVCYSWFFSFRFITLNSKCFVLFYFAFALFFVFCLGAKKFLFYSFFFMIRGSFKDKVCIAVSYSLVGTNCKIKKSQIANNSNDDILFHWKEW